MAIKLPGGMKIPHIDLPQVDVPRVALPSIEVPHMELPKLDTGRFTRPSVELPRIDLPSVELPRLELSGGRVRLRRRSDSRGRVLRRLAVVGLAAAVVGSIGGAVVFLDPVRGADRRADLSRRIATWRKGMMAGMGQVRPAGATDPIAVPIEISDRPAFEEIGLAGRGGNEQRHDGSGSMPMAHDATVGADPTTEADSAAAGE